MVGSLDKQIQNEKELTRLASAGVGKTGRRGLGCQKKTRKYDPFFSPKSRALMSNERITKENLFGKT